VRTDHVPRLSLLVLPWLLAGCALLGFGTADGNPSMTCAMWRGMTVEARLRLAVLERVRAAQHEAAGTSRDVLVREVEGSLTKNCDVMAPGNPLVLTLFNELYLAPDSGGPAPDAGAPTPRLPAASPSS
jgi:hypothetical protein